MYFLKWHITQIFAKVLVRWRSGSALVSTPIIWNQKTKVTKIENNKPSASALVRTEDNTLGIPNRMSALLAFKG